MIEIKGLTKTFKNGGETSTVLKNINVSFPDTGLIFIAGRSGSGKTTLLNAIGGLEDFQGHIFYDGKEVNQEEYRKKNIGFVFQNFLLLEDSSIEDNIAQALKISGIADEGEIDKKVRDSLALVNLSIDSNRSASALSLGQKQRVALARVVAVNPQIILADEPTGNLDTHNAVEVMNILKDLSKKHLVICASHNMNLIKLYADKVYQIDDRRLLNLPIEEIKADEEKAYSDEIKKVAGINNKQNEEGEVPNPQVSSKQKNDFSKLFAFTGNYSGKRKALRWLNVILPMIVFVLLNFMAGEFIQSKNSGLDRYSPDNQIGLVSSGKSSGLSVPASALSGWLNDEDSGIIDSDIYNSFLKTDGSVLSSYAPRAYLNSSMFSFNYLNVLNENLTFEQANIVSCDKYKKMAGLAEILSPFDLKDNQAVLDRSLFEKAFAKSPLFSKTVDEAVIGSTFKLNNSKDVFTVVGLVDTHSTAIYLNDKMTSRVRRSLFGIAASSPFVEMFEPFSLGDFLFVDYETVKNSSDYVFSKVNSAVTDDVFLSKCSQADAAPACFATSEAQKNILSSFSSSATPFIAFDDNTVVTYVPDIEKKVVCFVNYQSGSKTINSAQKFFLNYIRSSIRHTSETFKSSDITLSSGAMPADYGEILIPSSLLEQFASLEDLNEMLTAKIYSYSQYSLKVATATTGFTPKVSGAYSSTSIDSPVLITQELETRLEGIGDYIISDGTSASRNDNISSAIIQSGSLLVTNSPEKSLSYLESAETLVSKDVKPMTYSQAVYLTCGAKAVSQAWSLAVSGIVLLLASMAISVIDALAQVKKENHDIGVLRCLGMGKEEIRKNKALRIVQEWLALCVAPTVLLLLFFLCFGVYSLSWFYLIFIGAYLALQLISNEAPLNVTLQKTPSQIIKSV
jgi:ABC-type lipoprotein export system ATPase subunit